MNGRLLNCRHLSVPETGLHYQVVNASSSSGTPVGGSTSEGLNPRDFNQAIRQQTENRNQNNQDVHRRESNVRRPQQSDWDNEGDDDVEPHGGWRVFVSLGTFLAGFFLVWVGWHVYI